MVTLTSLHQHPSVRCIPGFALERVCIKGCENIAFSALLFELRHFFLNCSYNRYNTQDGVVNLIANRCIKYVDFLQFKYVNKDRPTQHYNLQIGPTPPLTHQHTLARENIMTPIFSFIIAANIFLITIMQLKEVTIILFAYFSPMSQHSALYYTFHPNFVSLCPYNNQFNFCHAL